MKNTTSSFTNKIGDINTEILRINKKLQNLETLNEKLESELKEETNLRKNIEKKTFHINETFNGKFVTLRKGFDDLTSIMTEQIENLKGKYLEDVHSNNKNFFTEFEESLKRMEQYEKNANNYFNELNYFKTDNNLRIVQLEELLSKELKDVKKEINSNNIKTEILEKKLTEGMFSLQKEMSEMKKDINFIKNDSEMLKKFKENTIFNFQDISQEFIKNEESFTKQTNKSLKQIQDFESKINNFESVFTHQNDNLTNIKKDIYKQLYDNNVSLNNKFQLMNDSIYEKFESYDKGLNTFQNSLIEENDKFTTFLTDQIDTHHKNVKKLIDYVNEDMDLIKNKSSSVEEMMKNIRNEFFNNLSEVEEFLVKKYESMLRSINSERDIRERERYNN